MATVDSKRDLLVSGLKDAYAMERQAEDMLSSQSQRLEDYPELSARISQHVEETRNQQRRLEECLSSLDESPSMLKDAAMRAAANLQAAFNATAQDEVIKDSLADYAFEHFEIASYKGLIALAELDGKSAIASKCQESLREEEAMASWIDGHLKDIVVEHARRTERGESSRVGLA
jgi:ferritin-like metal-binding protein YciE